MSHPAVLLDSASDFFLRWLSVMVGALLSFVEEQSRCCFEVLDKPFQAFSTGGQ
jgi:hypothetical protein